jgi:hypothetical protein
MVLRYVFRTPLRSRRRCPRVLRRQGFTLTSCPPSTDLAAFIDGSAIGETVALHLEACPLCRWVVDESLETITYFEAASAHASERKSLASREARANLDGRVERHWPPFVGRESSEEGEGLQKATLGSKSSS